MSRGSKTAPILPPYPEPPSEEKEIRPKDNWRRGLGSSVMSQCVTCMYFNNGRCRRHAPKGQEGWPAVYPSDYCGDHKLPKEALMA